MLARIERGHLSRRVNSAHFADHPIQTGVNINKPSSASSWVGGGQNGGMQHHGGRGH
jgi:hypothetical protein